MTSCIIVNSIEYSRDLATARTYCQTHGYNFNHPAIVLDPNLPPTVCPFGAILDRLDKIEADLKNLIPTAGQD